MFQTQVNEALAALEFHRAAIHKTHMLSSRDQPFDHRMDTPPFVNSGHNPGRKQNPAVKKSRNGDTADCLKKALGWLPALPQIEIQAGDPGDPLLRASTYTRTYLTSS